MSRQSTRAARVLDACKARQMMLTTAESCTGGLIIGALTDIAGSSAVVDRGFITYSNAAKVDMLGVEVATMKAHGAVSEQVAMQMAAGALARSDADIAMAVTGIAGPGGTDAKPEGMVCFGIATAQRTRSETQYFGPRGRAEVRRATVDHALDLILDYAIR